MDALLGMTAVLAALTLVVVLLLMFLLAWLIGAKKSADSGISQANEYKELYQKSIDLSHKGIESQAEMIAVMRELIEALRSQK